MYVHIDELKTIIKTYQKKKVKKLNALKEMHYKYNISLEKLSEIWLECKLELENPRKEPLFRGVGKDRKPGSWRVTIYIKGRPKYIGRYYSIEEAIRARLEAEEKYKDEIELKAKGGTKDGTQIARLTAGKRADNKSGAKGVFKNKYGTWAVHIAAQGKKRYIGTFSTFEDAVKARQEAEEIYHKPLIEKYKLEG